MPPRQSSRPKKPTSKLLANADTPADPDPAPEWPGWIEPLPELDPVPPASTSELWKYMRELKSPHVHGDKTHLCLLCLENFKLEASVLTSWTPALFKLNNNSTSNGLTHLRNVHKDVPEVTKIVDDSSTRRNDRDADTQTKLDVFGPAGALAGDKASLSNRFFTRFIINRFGSIDILISGTSC
jgi:hypothetical protein